MMIVVMNVMVVVVVNGYGDCSDECNDECNHECNGCCGGEW